MGRGMPMSVAADVRRLNGRAVTPSGSDQRERAVRLGALRLIGAVLVLAVVALGCTTQTSTKPPPHLANPAATADRLATHFFDLLQNNDVEGLRQFLSPAFEVERADGSGGNKAEYLANHPSITNFSISNVTATQDGSTLVARYTTTNKGLVNGKPETPGPSPRLSVFLWNGKMWQLVAHANFNPLAG